MIRLAIVVAVLAAGCIIPPADSPAACEVLSAEVNAPGGHYSSTPGIEYRDGGWVFIHGVFFGWAPDPEAPITRGICNLERIGMGEGP